MTDDAPPAPELDVPDGWTEMERTTEELFSVSRVTVTATTVVYEDERLRERVADAVGSGFRRFVFAGRLRLRPRTSPSKPLTKLVTSRAKSGFADRLRARGMTEVAAGESRRFSVRGTDATLIRYDATCPVEGATLAVDGWVAVWPGDDGYFVAGGAYPTAVADGPDLGDVVDPGRFRDELLDAIRSVR
jgi:hypothetical protein